MHACEYTESMFTCSAFSDIRSSGFKFAEMEMSECLSAPTHISMLTPYSELVISSLIEKLVFEPGPPVTWEMSGIVRPMCPESGSTKTQLPLRVSLLA